MASFTKEDVQSVARAMKNANDGVAFLTGAGCSLSAGIPLAAALVKEMNAKYCDEIARIVSAGNRESYGACMGALSLDERKSILDPYLKAAKINWANIGLASLIKHERVKRVLTLNFDNVLARACGLLGSYPAIYDFGVSPSSETGFLVSPSIIHLHGQGYGSTLLNSDDETRDHAKKVQPVIQDTLERWDLIVIGYSGAADKLYPILASAYALRKRIFWVGFDEVPATHLRPFLEKFKATVLYIGGADADAFLIALAQTMSCFPPDVFSDPAKHLLDEIADVKPFPLDKTDMKIDLLTDLRGSLERFGESLRLDPGREAALKGNRTRAIESGSAGRLSGEDVQLRAWAHYDSGTALCTASTIPNEADLCAALGEFEKAVNIKPDFHEALNNWGNALWDLAKLKSDETLFQKSFEKYAAALTIKPDRHEALNNWGNALLSLAELKSDETLFRQSFTKYAAALEIKRDDYQALFNWGNALLSLAELKSEETLFRQAFDKYAAALAIKPNMHEALNNWGAALLDLARLKNDEDLFKQAFDKYAAALAVKPDNHETFNNWGIALRYLATLKSDETLFQQAFEKYAAALAVKPDNHDALNNWGVALSKLAKLKGDDTLLNQAFDKYAAALAIKPDKHEALDNWGQALSTLAILKGDPTIFQQSFDKFAAALVIKPDKHETLYNWSSALINLWHLNAESSLLLQAQDLIGRAERLKPEEAYNGACLTAIMGDEDGCRTRLYRCKDAGTLPEKAHLLADKDLASMRGKDWFEALIDSLD